MASTYRGYEITEDGKGFMWTDEAGKVHQAPTEDDALDDIDAHKRALRAKAEA